MRIGPRFLIEGMGGVVGADDIDDTVGERAPQSGAMTGVANRRIDLSSGAQPGIGFWG